MSPLRLEPYPAGSELRLPRWTLPLLWVAAGKVVLSAVGLLWKGGLLTLATGVFLPGLMQLLFLVIYGVAAAILLLGGRQDRRTLLLGGFFLLLAAAQTNRPLDLLATAVPTGVATALLGLKGLEVDAFFPLFLWLFAGSFPAVAASRRERALLTAGIATATAAGLVLFSANLAAMLPGAPGGPPGELLARLSRNAKPNLFYPLLLTLVGTGLVFLVWRCLTRPAVERRRVLLFVVGLLAGFGPFIAYVVLLNTSGSVLAFMQRHPGLRVGVSIGVLGFPLSVPFTAAYSVLVHRVLGLKLIARQALQYALARGSAMALAVVPFVGLCIQLYRRRQETLQAVFAGPGVLPLASATLVGVAAVLYRGTLLDAIDRRFFREQYDARRILGMLVDQIRGVRRRSELADLLAGGIDRALHLETIALLVEDPALGVLADPHGRVHTLDLSSSLQSLVAGASEPLEVDPESPRSAFRGLAAEDRRWVEEGSFHLLVPIVGGDGSLLGILALGAKKSGLPFLREDRDLLKATASSAAMALELRRARAEGAALVRGEAPAGGPLPRAPRLEKARECPSCGRIFPPRAWSCATCGQRLVGSAVPYVLPGRFRFEQRVGVGGMGVVYRAADLTLGRPVAIKTLRRVSPEDAVRLRREARTAAAVSHPNLAGIFGVETWNGTPMLVLEFLEGGTVGDRLKQSTLTPGETIDLGIAMAGALERLHAADILHRDIKPSNIGFARDATPKLMDFGIARLQFDLRQEVPGRVTSADDVDAMPPTSIWNQPPTSATHSLQLVGTLSYLSPEVLNGEPPGPSLDLWSLCVVLHETLVGERLFDGEDQRGVMQQIRRPRVADIRDRRPDCPPALAEFFQVALGGDPGLRPATAIELRRRLEDVRSCLVA